MVGTLAVGVRVEMLPRPGQRGVVTRVPDGGHSRGVVVLWDGGVDETWIWEGRVAPVLETGKTRWTLLPEASPGGKRLYGCGTCGRRSVTPDKRCAVGCTDG